MSYWDIPGMKAGVIVGDPAWSLLKFAKEKGFAIPAFNCTSTSTVNAVLEAAMKVNRPVMIQFSEEGSVFFVGESLPNDKCQTSILGAVAGAHYVRMVAPAYGIPVLVHSDHCAKKLFPWLDGILEADMAFFQAHGEPLFSSHMLGLSEEPLDENISTCAEYLKKMAQMKMILEMEIGDATPEDVWRVWEGLSPISEMFTISSAKLQPDLLSSFQKFASEKLSVEKPYSFGFHGGSSSQKEVIDKAIDNGVVKISVDTDTQWAYWEGLLKFYKAKEDYLQKQIGNPMGEDVPNKSYYDPRKWVREAEVGMVSGVTQGCMDLRNVN